MSQERSLEDYLEQLTAINPDVRAYAAFVLGRNRDPRIVQPLLKVINDEEAAVRIRVVEALGTRSEEEVVPPIIDRLRHDPNATVRQTAARSLSYMGDKRATEALVHVLLNDDVENVRAQAAEALGNLKDSAALNALMQAMLADASNNVRQFARQALVNCHGSGVVMAIIAKIQETDDADDLIDLLETAGQIRDKRIVEAIRHLQDHDDPDVATTARWAVKALKG